MKKSISAVVFGLIIILLGVVYAGNVLELWSLDISFEGWWTLFIIVPCVMSIVSGGLSIINCVGLSIGLLFLLSEQGVLKDDIGYKLVMPVIIIAIGVGVLFRKAGKSKSEGNNGVFAGNTGDNYFAVFGGSSPQFSGQVFRGATSFAIFGGVDLRLRDSIIKRDCIIKTYSIFGGTDIFLPDNVRVVVSSIPVFGGVENKFISSSDEAAPTVYIRALSVFGATDIK